MSDCIFCAIVGGDIPCSKVGETAHALAFLDVAPAAPGHALVIPKAHHGDLFTAPDDLLGDLMGLVRSIGEAQKIRLGADGVNIVQSNGEAAGQVVPHLHVHVIPRFANDGLVQLWHGSEMPTDKRSAVAAKLVGA